MLTEKLRSMRFILSADSTVLELLGGLQKLTIESQAGFLETTRYLVLAKHRQQASRDSRVPLRE